MKKGVCVVSIALALLACKEDPTTGNGAGTGAVGGVGGVAGMAAGTGAGTGLAGTGGGAGGTAAGAGGMGAGGAVPGCSAADTSAPPAMLHAAAVEALAAMPPTSTCGGSTSCHQGTGKAGLSLLGQMNLRMALVDKPSCLAPTIPLVDDATGDAGLNNSWLWIKMTAPADATGALMSNAAWGTSGNCGQTPSQPFGVRMPWGFTGSMYFSDANMAKVRNWICAGAPGPM